MEINKIIHGDCLEVMSKMENGEYENLRYQRWKGCLDFQLDTQRGKVKENQKCVSAMDGILIL